MIMTKDWLILLLRCFILMKTMRKATKTRADKLALLRQSVPVGTAQAGGWTQGSWTARERAGRLTSLSRRTPARC